MYDNRILDNGQLITKDVSPPLGSDGQSLLRNNISLTNPTRLNNAFNNFTYPKGSDVFKVRREAGDHLLVNRFTYNFRKPKRGEIIVFETKNIPDMDNDKLFYILPSILTQGATIQKKQLPGDVPPMGSVDCISM